MFQKWLVIRISATTSSRNVSNLKKCSSMNSNLKISWNCSAMNSNLKIIFAIFREQKVLEATVSSFQTFSSLYTFWNCFLFDIFQNPGILKFENNIIYIFYTFRSFLMISEYFSEITSDFKHLRQQIPEMPATV